MELNKNLWNNRYENQDTAWDLGEISPPIKNYIDQLENKNLKILIPGCGNAYEAEYLNILGFNNVYIIDWAKKALQNFRIRMQNFPKKKIICEDFFQHQGQYDLIIEQTFFCAIHPSLREKYAIKMNTLLADKGSLIGLLFNEKLYSNRPPFGGSEVEYRKLFTKYFSLVSINKAKDSISSRKGRELFFIIKK